MSGPAWADAGPTALAAFLASLVEFTEALTVVLAVGGVRGWRDTLAGVAAAIGALAFAGAMVGSALGRVPLGPLRLVAGGLLLLFGLRWLRKAVLREAGIVPVRDEAAAFDRQTRAMQATGAARSWDAAAFGPVFQVTLVEGAEVVFIVIAAGAGRPSLLLASALGATAALLAVMSLGVALRRPLAKLPENALKFAGGVLLSATGAFWAGEGVGIAWPGDSLAIPILAALLALAARAAVARIRSG